MIKQNLNVKEFEDDKQKFTFNLEDIPGYLLDCLARSVLAAARKFYEDPANQAEFEAWNLMKYERPYKSQEQRNGIGARQNLIEDTLKRNIVSSKRFAYLRGCISAAGYEERDIAKLLNRSPAYLSNCFNGKSDLGLSEQYKIIEAIKGDITKMHLYFPENGIAKEMR